MKLSDRLANAAKYADDVVITRLGYVHPDFEARMNVCKGCPSNVEEPLAKDESLSLLMGLEDRMCNECGCGIKKLCASRRKKCELKKW